MSWATSLVPQYYLISKEDIECPKEELLGPVLLCMQVCPMFLRLNSIDEAINFVNQKIYCYGTSIFTGSRVLAWKFQIEIETRQVCINAVVPAPLPSSSAGSELSFAGDLNAIGKHTQNICLCSYYLQKKNCDSAIPTSEGGSDRQH